jgi:DNA-binding MarR family transcriptional regulator
MIRASDEDRRDDANDPVRTITLSERDIQAAARLLLALIDPEVDRGREMDSLARSNVHRIGSPDRSVLVARARQAYSNRARRSKVFNSIMFGEAAWDMLLALYATDPSEARHTVSGLTTLSGVAPTTALRWLNFLEKEDLVSRVPNPLDARVSRILLTDKARALLDTYFSATDTKEP